MTAADWSYVAEDADAYQALPRSAVREMRSDVVLLHRPDRDAWSNIASRVRFAAPTVDSSIATTRAWFAAHLVTGHRWLIGPSATPAGIMRILLERGAIRDESEPILTAMVLDREPPSVTGIAIREAVTFDDFEQMEGIREAVFGGEDQERLGRSSERRRRWTEFAATDGAAAFLAELDGAPVAFGVM